MNKLYKKLVYYQLFYAKLQNLRYKSSLTGIFNDSPQSVDPNQPSTGLFCIPELTSHTGFDVIKNKCIIQCTSLVKEATDQNRKRHLVQIFDELSDSLCRVADLAEFIRLSHPSPVYNATAENTCVTISGIVEKLNTNRELYLVLEDVVKNGDKFPTSSVDKHVASLFLADFKLSGIHLSESERNRIVLLNDLILQLGQEFIAGCNKSRVARKETLPENAKNLFTCDSNGFIHISSLYIDSNSSLAREVAYRIYLFPDTEQDRILNELLRARYELARICGFQSYAHRALKGSVLETPETVIKLLDHLNKGLKERAEKDFQILGRMKVKENPSCSPLAAWDTPYFSQKAKKEWFNVCPEDFSPYFSLGTCMDGLNLLFYQLYGIRLADMRLRDGEGWTRDIYKLRVEHERDGLLGFIYCDFYERERKPKQDCHFTIQGGRELPNGAYQLPIVVLSLNLPPPRWFSPPLLTPPMVDNLFHEMGHAMHSMLARTKYQHVTGTRCSTDLAEVPSILMEYFASDPRVLKTFAKHFQTNEAISDDMVQRLCVSKNLFIASEMQMQVFYSALDQTYHVHFPLKGTTTQVLANVQNEYYSLPYVQNTAWQLRFGHIVGYGSKYYSYLASKSLASLIWQTYFQKDPVCRENGQKYRSNFLAHGGGKPALQLVADFLQRKPTADLLADSLFKEIDEKQQQIYSFIGDI